MPEITVLIAVGILVAVAACGAESKPPSVGIVEDTKSALTIIRTSGKEERKERKDLIYFWEGDQITIAEGGAAVLLFFGGTKQTLTTGKYEVTSKGCKPLGGSPLPSQAIPHDSFVAGAKKQGMSGISQATGRGAGLVIRNAHSHSRSTFDDEPPAVVPIREELVVSDRPNFHWRVGKPPFRVHLLSATNNRTHTPVFPVPDPKESEHLLSATKNRPLWSADSEKPELAFPDDEPPLKRNRKYRWEIWSLVNPKTLELVAESTFTVASEDTSRALQEVQPLVRSDSSFELLLAVASFQAYGAESEALAACEKLLKQLPRHPEVLRLAADLYDRAGRTHEREAAYSSALKFGMDDRKDQ